MMEVAKVTVTYKQQTIVPILKFFYRADAFSATQQTASTPKVCRIRNMQSAAHRRVISVTEMHSLTVLSLLDSSAPLLSLSSSSLHQQPQHTLTAMATIYITE